MSDVFTPARIEANGQVRHGDDRSLYVEFYDKAVPDRPQSLAENRAVFKTVTYCRVHVPGSRNVVDQPMKESDRLRFPGPWAVYERNKDGGASMDGTPLKEWPHMTVSQIAQLNALGIFVVEQLAALNDHGLQAVGVGARDMKAMAAVWLDKAESAGKEQALAVENQRLKDDLARQSGEISALAAQMQSLQRQLDRQPAGGVVTGAEIPVAIEPDPVFAKPTQPLYDAPKRGPGRPRKSPA